MHSTLLTLPSETPVAQRSLDRFSDALQRLQSMDSWTFPVTGPRRPHLPSHSRPAWTSSSSHMGSGSVPRSEKGRIACSLDEDVLYDAGVPKRISSCRRE